MDIYIYNIMCIYICISGAAASLQSWHLRIVDLPSPDCLHVQLGFETAVNW